jgi:hypothetical protein
LRSSTFQSTNNPLQRSSSDYQTDCSVAVGADSPFRSTAFISINPVLPSDLSKEQASFLIRRKLAGVAN